MYHGKAHTFPPRGPNDGTHETIRFQRIPIRRSDQWASSGLLAIVRYLSMPPSTRDITTEAEFNSALQLLLLSALNNGLDPQGAWEYRNGQNQPDLEVLVTELAKSS